MDIRLRTGSKAVFGFILVAVACLAVSNAAAEAPALLGDLDSLQPEKLSKEQLEQLLPGARMMRKNAATGSTHHWTNEADGTFIISSDNRASMGGGSLMSGSTTAPGKWHVSPDGRYCVTIEWKKIPTEDWCRYVFKTSEGFFGSKSDKDRAAKIYRLTINGN
jgi:hypothetical protein